MINNFPCAMIRSRALFLLVSSLRIRLLRRLFRRSGWSAGWTSGLGLWVCFGLASTACAIQAPPERLDALSIQGLRWEPVQSMSMSGVPAFLRTFSSGGAAAGVAQLLAVNTDLFQRVLTLPGTIVLSGLQADWHWLAQVDTQASGTKGYVSAMHIDPSLANADQPDPEQGFAWLPAQARRQFAHRSDRQSRTVAQYVYSIALPVPTFTAYVRQQLRAEGWEAEPFMAGLPAHNAWRREASRLVLFPQAGPTGTTLYVHHVE